jgi:acyl-CoA thioesterase
VLWRDPLDEWLLLSAAANIGAQGSGMVGTTICDRDGALGSATQTLIVAQRQPG